uniref:Uncharacterized protein n=1 Tax=Glossina pallidipes TaxID=7398 RepID=A0A1B0A1S5_GLOPL
MEITTVQVAAAAAAVVAYSRSSGSSSSSSSSSSSINGSSSSISTSSSGTSGSGGSKICWQDQQVSQLVITTATATATATANTLGVKSSDFRIQHCNIYLHSELFNANLEEENACNLNRIKGSRNRTFDNRTGGNRIAGQDTTRNLNFYDASQPRQAFIEAITGGGT